jgi:hypothetical protein
LVCEPQKKTQKGFRRSNSSLELIPENMSCAHLRMPSPMTGTSGLQSGGDSSIEHGRHVKRACRALVSR